MITLSLDFSIKPIQQPLRRIPIALEEKFERKINEALVQDIIQTVVGPSSWISPIVPYVFKGNGKMRLCVDMRRANHAVLRENYPLPTFESVMTKLREAKIFSRLDLKWAYHQLELDEESREITTFITHKGLFRYKRLMFGINSAPGESAMKSRIRAKVWWSLVDREVEAYVSQSNNPEPMKRHASPDGPWQCVAADLLGPLPNSDYVFVLILYYYSRYQEVKYLRRITSEIIITVLNEIFCRLGIPKSIRADIGRQFVSGEFRNFCDDHNITLITTPPYWPQANGEVENMNRSLVKRLKIAHNNRRDYVKEIQNFLLMYNVTPHGTTGTPPTELMFNRVIRD
ncbi:uncharacterized protein K02A2.6-like [Anastrepha obliqua]|uniref:uncharacterized protein K02A2.6-like n=1 Tax=Anastrepha obliqua TaxID=95512 RepID=UPI00240A0FDC|nr:uncharacterized protein K02A2.6-like [Anastrepha obliqua]